jgi:hypothetical protein
MQARSTTPDGYRDLPSQVQPRAIDKRIAVATDLIAPRSRVCGTHGELEAATDEALLPGRAVPPLDSPLPLPGPLSFASVPWTCAAPENPATEERMHRAALRQTM